MDQTTQVMMVKEEAPDVPDTDVVYVCSHETEEAPVAAAPAKVPKKRAPRPKKIGPTLSELIVKAVSASRERSGVSLAALKKALSADGYDARKQKARVNHVVNILVNKEILLRIKGTGASGSFKINKEKNKKPAKNAASETTKPAAKKLAATKSSKKTVKKTTAAKTSEKATKSPEKTVKNTTAAKIASKVKKPTAAKTSKKTVKKTTTAKTSEKATKTSKKPTKSPKKATKSPKKVTKKPAAAKKAPAKKAAKLKIKTAAPKKK